MYVEIDDDRALNEAFGTQSRDGDRDIVDHAKPFPMIGERVVRASGEIAGQSALERGTRRLQRSAGGQTRAPPELLRPRQTEAPLFRRRKSRELELVEIGARVDERSGLDIDGLGLENVAGCEQTVGHEPIPQEQILGHRKRVRRRQDNPVTLVITTLHGP